jgi:ribosomal protein S12 methylthiotransferase
MALQYHISEELNQQIVGHTVPVLIEGQSPETDLLLKGRTATMAPDVDAQVLINKGEGVIGEIMPVRIREAYAYDIIGEIVG